MTSAAHTALARQVAANGTQLTLGACNGSAGQQWTLPGAAGHDQAVAAAKAADLAVVFVNKFESEGSDLSDINLPADQNQLVAASRRPARRRPGGRSPN